MSRRCRKSTASSMAPKMTRRLKYHNTCGGSSRRCNIAIFVALIVAFCSHVAAQDCTMNIFITELANPADDPFSRFVELYSPDALEAPTIITEDLYLLRWTNANADPTLSTKISLKNQLMTSDGFLVVCSSGDAQYGSPCDVIGGTGGPADSNGDDQIALVCGDPSVSYSIVDIFGVPGEDGTGTGHDFVNGRAERKADVSGPSPTWDAAEWNVCCSATTCANECGLLDVVDMDPWAWIGPATTDDDGIVGDDDGIEEPLVIEITGAEREVVLENLRQADLKLKEKKIKEQENVQKIKGDCTKENIEAHGAKRDSCLQACNTRACCFEPGLGNCFKQRKQWCMEAQDCEVLEEDDPDEMGDDPGAATF